MRIQLRKAIAAFFLLAMGGSISIVLPEKVTRAAVITPLPATSTMAPTAPRDRSSPDAASTPTRGANSHRS